jgi:hypothetical protein
MKLPGIVRTTDGLELASFNWEVRMDDNLRGHFFFQNAYVCYWIKSYCYFNFKINCFTAIFIYEVNFRHCNSCPIILFLSRWSEDRCLYRSSRLNWICTDTHTYCGYDFPGMIFLRDLKEAMRLDGSKDMFVEIYLHSLIRLHGVVRG